MNRRHLLILAIALFAIGTSLFLYKAFVLDFPLTRDATAQRWDVDLRIRFHATGGPVKITQAIPKSALRASLLHENFVSRGYGLSTLRHDGGRHAIWSIRKARGEQALYYRATVQLNAMRDEEEPDKAPEVTQGRQFDEAELTAATNLLERVRSRSADQETLALQLLEMVSAKTADNDVDLLLGPKADLLQRVLLVRELLALEDMPARIIHAIRLDQDRKESLPEPWLQVFGNKRWLTFDPESAQPGMPANLLVIGYGQIPLLSIEGAKKVESRWSVSRSSQAALTAALERGRLFSKELIDFSLFSLPIETQSVYRVLLLIPIGAFMLAVLRNVIGVKTFGTFMPILIALAFRETHLLAGIVLFIVLVSLGLSVRFYLEQLKLLLVPRLASLLIIVVGLMALVSVISHQLGLERGLSVALFPMVIITMTIERMSIVWDERGAAEALQQGFGSLLVAALAYLAMFNAIAEHLIFVFPELLLVLLAATLLLGRYTGYRLMELGRFKALAERNK